METTKLKIGLFGFGVVGEGLYEALQLTPSLNAEIVKVCIKDPNKKRNAPAHLFTTDATEVWADTSINAIVEVINDPVAALSIVERGLKEGKHIVSASKKMIADNFEHLLELRNNSAGSFLYEAAACASIPVIRNLEEYYDNDLLQGLRAIVNGSTNFILSKMTKDRLAPREALILAQQAGFAETDPTLDLHGFDALHKWSFLLTHAYGIIPEKHQILFSGIQHIEAEDVLFAASRGWQVRLVATARKLNDEKIAAFILPEFVKTNDRLSAVDDEFNGIVVESGLADHQFFLGKGAGSFPTASAILSDLSALRYGYRYEYRKLYLQTPSVLSKEFYLKVFVSFENKNNIPKSAFESIDEWHAGEGRSYLLGVISYSHLQKDHWWKKAGISLILQPEPILEDISIRKLKKRSLELAGVWD